MALIHEVAKDTGLRAPVSIRVNPDVDPETHPYISTGLKENKFGVSVEEAIRLYQQAHESDRFEIRGIDCHIGSQITSLSPFLDALTRILALLDDLAPLGIQVDHIDLVVVSEFATMTKNPSIWIRLQVLWLRP